MAEAQKLTPPKVVVIGGSAGSLTVLLAALPDIRDDFPSPIIVITHRHSSPDGLLELLLSTRTTLRVKEAEEKEQVLPGYIYLAPPDYHLLFERDGTMSIDVSEKVNYSRPSIDVSFESAADVYGGRLIALLLSGANADGAQGLVAVQSHGGTTIVQDPLSAEVDYMPAQALHALTPDHVVNVAAMAPLLNALVMGR